MSQHAPEAVRSFAHPEKRNAAGVEVGGNQQKLNSDDFIAADRNQEPATAAALLAALLEAQRTLGRLDVLTERLAADVAAMAGEVRVC